MVLEAQKGVALLASTCYHELMAQDIAHRLTCTEDRMAFNDMQLSELKEILGVDSFNTRISDELDFHEIGVWQLVEALSRAERIGYSRGRRETIEQVHSTGVG